jgi:hypothetical protein
MKRALFILFLVLSIGAKSQVYMPWGLHLGQLNWCIDSVFIRNDSLIFQVNDTLEFGKPLVYVDTEDWNAIETTVSFYKFERLQAILPDKLRLNRV